jgi:hypothetical protein
MTIAVYARLLLMIIIEQYHHQELLTYNRGIIGESPFPELLLLLRMLSTHRLIKAAKGIWIG